MPAPDLEPLLAWGRSLGLVAEPADVSLRPWSTTARLGRVWLKACGPGARHEAALLQRTRLADDVRRAVEAVLPEVRERFAALAAGPVAATVQHDDLHDGNLMVDAGGVTRVIDWGDCSVGHPFGVLLVTLRALGHRYGLEPAELTRLRDAYLEAWTDLADRATVDELASCAVRVQPVGRTLSWERALVAADAAELASWGEAVPGWLAVLGGLDD